MKTQEEIKKEAEERFWKWNGKDYMDNEITHLEKSKYVSGYLGGYNQCQEDISNSWTKGCECKDSIGQTWCCNQCGLPYDTRKSKRYTEEDIKKAIRYGFDVGFASNSSNNTKNDIISEDKFINSLKTK